jgi:hypothetical protein
MKKGGLDGHGIPSGAYWLAGRAREPTLPSRARPQRGERMLWVGPAPRFHGVPLIVAFDQAVSLPERAACPRTSVPGRM